MFKFTPQEHTVVSVKYMESIEPNITSAGQKVKASFALRGIDASGIDWWIGKADPVDTSTFWQDTPYIFEVEKDYTDIVADDFKFEVSELIDISYPVFTGSGRMETRVWDRGKTRKIIFWTYTVGEGWVTTTYAQPTTLQKVGQLYLDIYPISRTIPTSPITSWFPFWSQFGDVDVDVDVEIPQTVLETDFTSYVSPCGVPTYYTGIQNFQLDIFDTSVVQFTNGLYNMDSSGNLRTIWGWRDNPVDNYAPIADKYVETLGNMYWKPRYNLSLDVRSKDSSIFTVGNIYTMNQMAYPDGSLMEFICNGLDYNVKANAYRLELLEYDQDANWKVDPVLPYFNVEPSTLVFNSSGYPVQKIDIASNFPWSWTESDSWLVQHAYANGKYHYGSTVPDLQLGTLYTVRQGMASILEEPEPGTLAADYTVGESFMWTGVNNSSDFYWDFNKCYVTCASDNSYLTNSSTAMYVACSTLAGADRDSSIYFIPSGDASSIGTKYVRIHQDSSESTPYVEFDNYGGITLNTIGAHVIDISIKMTASASVYSNFGYTRSTDCTDTLYIDGEAYSSTYAQVTTNTSDTQTVTDFYNILNVKDTSTMYVDIVLGPWQGDQEADCYAAGYAQITQCRLHGTNTDVSVRYNRWDVQHYAGGSIQSYRSYE